AAAGPLILPQVTGDDAGCLRSQVDYPALTAPRIKVSKFVDRTCSSALMDAYWNGQAVDIGTARPPQRASIDADTKVVTIQFGGNDLPFGDLLQACIQFNPFGPGCTSTYLTGGRDLIQERLDQVVGPRYDAVLADIKARAPQAKVFVVGYLTYVPETGSGCWSPWVPILNADIPYLRKVNKGMNATIKRSAERAGFTYVDVATPSIGHDFCTEGNRWVEPLIPSVESFAAPVHPNAAGMRAIADVLAPVINHQVA
ncbi:MAG: SGNH/GDSL hydrolase family protein, partial [Actinobacteria bacterium]|nr:SGNH/GDSL hydrolase family protein [Actinomycetota bacterium]